MSLKGTGARHDAGKVSFTLLPLHLLAGAARVQHFGSQKYAAWNWAKGMPWSKCVDCVFRHLYKWWFLGQDYDDESGEHHLDHIICNLLYLRHYVVSYKDGDDRPPSELGFAEFIEEFSFTGDQTKVTWDVQEGAVAQGTEG